VPALPFERVTAAKGRISMRRARADEMYACAQVFVRAVNDLSRRQGVPVAPRKPKRIAARLGHLRRTDPGGFQVAVKDGRVVAFASTILREKIHFLSMFWMLPSLQSKGVGQALLKRAFDGVEEPPGTIRCVYASFDHRAQRLYLKFGMVPRSVVYGLGADSITLPKPPSIPVELVQVGEPGQITREALAIAAALDGRVRGCRRDADIAFTLSEKGTRFFEAQEDGAPVGYIMVTGSGMVGPGGTIHRRYNEGLAWSALAAAQDQSPKEIRMQLTGLNIDAVNTAFRAGLRIVFMGAWMTQREFGKLDCYFATAGDIF
jgi:GNAT superfamily N-acetyltransferase